MLPRAGWGGSGRWVPLKALAGGAGMQNLLCVCVCPPPACLRDKQAPGLGPGRAGGQDGDRAWIFRPPRCESQHCLSFPLPPLLQRDGEGLQGGLQGAGGGGAKPGQGWAPASCRQGWAGIGTAGRRRVPRHPALAPSGPVPPPPQCGSCQPPPGCAMVPASPPQKKKNDCAIAQPQGGYQPPQKA